MTPLHISQFDAFSLSELLFSVNLNEIYINLGDIYIILGEIYRWRRALEKYVKV